MSNLEKTLRHLLNDPMARTDSGMQPVVNIAVPEKHLAAYYWVCDISFHGVGKDNHPFLETSDEKTTIRCFTDEAEKEKVFLSDLYDLVVKHTEDHRKKGGD